MLPPVDPALLWAEDKTKPGKLKQTNFGALYQVLSENKLNPDGSSRDKKRQEAADNMRLKLKKLLIARYKAQILTTALSALPYKSPDLDPDLHPSIDVATAHLTRRVADTDRAILAADIETFKSHAPEIGTALSTHLTTHLSPLRTLASPISPPSPRDTPQRALHLHTTATQTLPHAITSATQLLTNTTTSLLASHRATLESAIRALEQTQHGALARYSRAAADESHARATLLGRQAKIHILSRPPPKEFVDALKGWRKAQGAGERRLRDREVLARRALVAYGRVEGLKEIARRKRELCEGVERIEGEVGRVGRG